MILDYTYFQGELFLPNVRKDISAGVADRALHVSGTNTLEYFIDRYEPEFLFLLLGKGLYDAFREGIREDPIPEKWVRLRDAIYVTEGNYKFSPAANYVYYHFKSDMLSRTTATGEKRVEMDYGRDIDEADKMCRAWNDMCRWVRGFRCGFIADNREVYRVYGYWGHRFSMMNKFNI